MGTFAKFTLFSAVILIVLAVVQNADFGFWKSGPDENYADEVEETVRKLNETSQPESGSNSTKKPDKPDPLQTTAESAGIGDGWQNVITPTDWTHSELNTRTRLYKSPSGFEVCQVVIDNIGELGVTREELFESFESDVSATALYGIQQALEISGMGSAALNSVTIDSSTTSADSSETGQWRKTVVVSVSLKGKKLQTIIYGMSILSDERLTMQCGGKGGRIGAAAQEFLKSVRWK